MRTLAAWLIGFLFASMLSTRAPAGTLEEVTARGSLRCGVDGGVPGLSYRDQGGRWSGLDVDFCRAVAAAVLGDKDKLEPIALTLAERLDALRQGRVDLLARNTTWTLSRDLAHGMSFVGILYHDGQGFLVPRHPEILSALDLGGKRVCVLAETTGPDNARRFFLRHRMEVTLAPYPDLEAAKEAYLAGTCDALSDDQTQLFSLRTTLEDPGAHRILGEVISKEPLGPAVRKGDARWFDIVRWTLFLMIDAEELGIDSTNLERVRNEAQATETRVLLDLDGKTAVLLGLEPEWGLRILRQVGNYGEIFERNLGSGSPLAIKRGLNALWRDGGILYAPPAR